MTHLNPESEIVVKQVLEFDMAHRLSNHLGKCKNLHGHRYKVELEFIGTRVNNENSPEEGMVIDFGNIKQLAKTWVDDTLDHVTMLHVSDTILIDALSSLGLQVRVTDYPPTAEAMAEYIFNALDEEFEPLYQDKDFELRSVTLWETPSSSAYYTRQKQE